jgi:hypothetical protein
MKKRDKMTPEELERQLDNQRRLRELLERRRVLDEKLRIDRQRGSAS